MTTTPNHTPDLFDAQANMTDQTSEMIARAQNIINICRDAVEVMAWLLDQHKQLTLTANNDLAQVVHIGSTDESSMPDIAGIDRSNTLYSSLDDAIIMFGTDRKWSSQIIAKQIGRSAHAVRQRRAFIMQSMKDGRYVLDRSLYARVPVIVKDVDALDQFSSRRYPPRTEYPHARAPWTSEDDAMLIGYLQMGMDKSAIAEKMGRTEDAIKRRCNRDKIRNVLNRSAS